MKKQDDRTPLVDIKQVLVEFWLDAIKNAPDYSDRLKASENLAKYFLAEGKLKGPQAAAKRPTTSDILRLVNEQMDMSMEDLDDPPEGSDGFKAP